ncbi:hypothetical protein FUAX_41760 (plasmid) [Fulvitalea axinellae]|uniref:Uncharacterized protein n=2 Tax=Fulvitalea axinellae TaxID=1182444 RepID=A0AAU9CHV5_9BACT|nr:hypothetical protein FUAX_41760 [Fulvitalea axinellae]
MVPFPKVILKAGQRVVLDDASTVVQGEEEDKEVWYQAYTDGVFDDFWIKDSFFEWAEATNSFPRMLEMFEECWDGRLMRRKDFVRYSGPLKNSLYSHYVKNKKVKPECPEPEQRRIAKGLVKTFLDRPKEDAGLTQSAVGYPTKNYTRQQLASLRDYSGLCSLFLKVTSKGGEGTNQKATPSASRDVPFRYDVYLNIPAPSLLAVMKDLVPLLDQHDEESDMDIDSISVAPLLDLAQRPDSVCVRVNSETGFERLKVFLIDYVGRHKERFVDESLCMTERFARGASWSQDPLFSNVWEMDERLINSVSRFLARVNEAWEAYRKKPPFFDLHSGWWSEIHQMHQRVSEQMASEQKGMQISKKDLRQMDKIAKSLKIQGLSGNVTEWMDHYERYEDRLVKDRKTFLGTRTEALAQLAEKKIKKKNMALRTFMRLCAYHGIDFYHPYRNLPIKPFTDEDLVVVSGDQGLEEWAAEATAPEAVFLPKIDFPKETEKQSTATANYIPGLGREMTTFRSEQEEALECVRDTLSKAFLQVVAGDERQRLKTEKPNRPENEGSGKDGGAG